MWHRVAYRQIPRWPSRKKFLKRKERKWPFPIWEIFQFPQVLSQMTTREGTLVPPYSGLLIWAQESPAQHPASQRQKTMRRDLWINSSRTTPYYAQIWAAEVLRWLIPSAFSWNIPPSNWWNSLFHPSAHDYNCLQDALLVNSDTLRGKGMV